MTSWHRLPGLSAVLLISLEPNYQPREDDHCVGAHAPPGEA